MNVTIPASRTFTCLNRIADKTKDTIKNISAVMLPETSALVTGPGENNFLNCFTTLNI
jgi:hypothetical protein